MAIITIGSGPRNGERRPQADFRANGKDDVGRTRREFPVEDFVLVCTRGLQKIKREILSFLIAEFAHTPLESRPLR